MSEQVIEVPLRRHVIDSGRPFAAVLDGTRVAYDTVASALAPYHDAPVAEVAERLDAEVLGLLRQATGVPAAAGGGAAP